MVDEREWREFRESGFLWWVNMILHTFGWAIVVDVEDDGRISRAYPARVRFRGFDEKSNSKGYRDVSGFMEENAGQLRKEADE